MARILQLKVIIPPDRRLELAVPSNFPVGPAEITVTSGCSSEPNSRQTSRGIDEERGWIADDFNDPLPADLQALFEGQG